MNIDFDTVNEMSRRDINKMFRNNDESRLWPINGKFNATERAIRRVNRMERHNGSLYGYEYAMAIDEEISKIVNSAM